MIDSLFGNENVHSYVNIIKEYMEKFFYIKNLKYKESPILKTKFQKLQKTDLEAELFFINVYKTIDIFAKGKLEDARLYGDGYDFQVSNNINSYLVEIKGIREKKDKFRLTQKEYEKALEYKDNYIITVVLNLNESPKINTIINPLKNLDFQEKIINSKIVKEYHLAKTIC